MRREWATVRRLRHAALVIFRDSRAFSFSVWNNAAGHQQTPVEQLPFGADLDRLVLFRPEDLVGIAVQRRRQAAILRAGAVELGADRVRRRRIGDIDAARSAAASASMPRLKFGMSVLLFLRVEDVRHAILPCRNR